VVSTAPGGLGRPRVGVLSVQGAFAEHADMLAATGADPVDVRTPAALEGLDASVLPGGGSTTLGLVSEASGLLPALRDALGDGLPALGTCAGMIMLARGTTGGAQPLVGGMDIVVRRNAFGRQRHSFETALEVPALGPQRVEAVFIRAPWIEEAGPGVEVLAEHAGHPVAAREGS
jgi:5'-phosphate synthase pdxT subunit